MKQQQKTTQTQTFVSAINGAKFDVDNSLTASLLGKADKKEIIHRVNLSAQQTGKKGKQGENEQEIQ